MIISLEEWSKDDFGFFLKAFLNAICFSSSSSSPYEADES